MAENAGKPVKKYEVTASFREGVVTWTFAVMTDDGQKYFWEIRDGEEVPLLMELCRRDWSIYFNPETNQLSSGWNMPGLKDSGPYSTR